MKEAVFAHSFVCDGVTTNVYHANIGEGLGKHEHTYSHITFCAAGSCWVSKENKKLLIDKHTQPILLPADEWHEIEAAEDNTVFINIFGPTQQTEAI